MPKLSVIIPVYNTDKYLNECIDSILAQTFTDFELILVDDGSTDKSGSICDEYAQMDSRIKVVHQKNAGVTPARKAGAALANGDYVTYVDSDDWIDADTYSKMMSRIEKHNADVGIFALISESSTPSVIINYIGEGVFSQEKLRNELYPKMLFDYSLKRVGILPSLCNKVIKRELLQKAIAVIPDDLDYGEDAIAAYLCILNSSTVFICNDPFYHYRDNPVSITHAASAVMQKRLIYLARDMREHLSEYGESISSQIDGYIMFKTVSWVCRDLVELTDIPFSKRRCLILDFCKHPQITRSLENAYPYVCFRKDKIKILLIKYRCFSLLYVLLARNKIIRPRGAHQ